MSFLIISAARKLVIHNASFDIGFMDYEFGLLKRDIPKTNTFCKVTDSLALARKMFPGKRNSLDALCSRYEIDNSKRTLHGALLDAQILAEVYLAMTGGQTSMTFAMEERRNGSKVKRPFSESFARPAGYGSFLPLRKSWLRMNRDLIWCRKRAEVAFGGRNLFLFRL